MLGQQVGTPGQWVAGVRTVDRRTGRRWRCGGRWRRRRDVGGNALARGLRHSRPVLWPDPQEREREIRAIRDAHRGDEDAMNAALMDYYGEHGAPAIDLARVLYVPLGLALVQSLLRKRLTPTAVVRREREPEGLTSALARRSRSHAREMGHRARRSARSRRA